MRRREFVSGLAGLTALQAFMVDDAAALGLQTVGKPVPFDYAGLKGQARALASRPYKSPKVSLPAPIGKLDWDQFQSIRYLPDHALWRDDGLRFQARFFHLGLYFNVPVRMHEVADGQARELAYTPDLFDYGKSGLQNALLPKDLGFAGFRLNFGSELERDVTAFLGASYFRAVGSEFQYGLSARGLAVDAGFPRPEEFPDFIGFWLEKPSAQSNSLVVHALLDSPSISGAYRFVIKPGNTQVMDVDAALYPRRTIERLGIAPATSMYQYGENDRRKANDWRPEIHDSDGLALWTGAGEWIWRPLNNPASLRFNAFVDENPRGFGLLQRDRNFDHYQDDGVFYDRRPCLWIEPRSGWGKGWVQLVEIPTVDETSDNIVAFWNPEQKPEPGQELLYAYRLYWGARAPVQPDLATCVATRTGIGGIVGQKRSYYSGRFAVDFAGGKLASLPAQAKVTPMISASSGRIELASARPLDAIKGWRALFDVVPTLSDSPVDLRLYLSLDDKPLTETWLYQWSPPPPESRPLD